MVSPKSTWYKPWTRLELTRELAIAVVKCTIPSTAALWIIQSTTLGQQFDTVGFLPIIMTILMTPAQPRIPFFRLLIFTLFLNCIVLCICLLAGYCSTQARLHATPTNGSLGDYNSSAAAVSGVWLFASVWALQTFRTYYPRRAKSVIMCSIFTEVSIITSTTLPDMASVIPFNIQLFEMFLLGYAFSAFTSLFIFPQTSRDVTLSDIKTMFDLSKKATSLEKPFGDLVSPTTDPSYHTAADHLAAFSRLFAKFQIDVRDAKRDVGYSRFSSKDLNVMSHHFRLFLSPLRGLFAIESIRTTLNFGPQSSEFDREIALEDLAEVNSKERWDLIFEKLQEPMSNLRQLTGDAIDHCRISLRMTDSDSLRSKAAAGGKAKEDTASEKAARQLPGGAGFFESFERQIEQQRDALRHVTEFLKTSDGLLGSVDEESHLHRQTSPTASQGRLLFTLYIEHLYNGILDGLLELVIFCDSRYANSKRKLQLPGKRRALKLIRRLIDRHHVEGDMEDMTSEIPNLTPTRSRLNEVRPPKKRGISLDQINAWLDKPFDVFGSKQSFFAFRVACAVISVAIVGFLERTQQWFFNRRGIWAVIFIPFSMAPSSGEAKSMLFYRILGSLFSIPLSLVNWYIVDGKPAGVIVFYFVIAGIQQYFIVKFPQWGRFWTPCIITYSIIVGYTLQAKHSSVPQPPATTTDQFPIYVIGPYRCLCTLVGVAMAYIWTVFPRPNSANTIMRHRLGQALFGLAEYHSCMHSAISTWAEGHEGDVTDKSSLGYRLMKARQLLFVKETALLAVIRDQHKFAGFDIILGGANPEHRYVAIADEIDQIMSYLNVVIFVASHFQSHIHNRKTSTYSQHEGSWEAGFKDLLGANKTSSMQIASLIHILASSVTNDQPLPPFLEAPKPFTLARKLREVRPDLMDVRHANEEGFKAFAVIEVSVAMVAKSLDRILVLVRDMVGEVGIDIGDAKNK